MIVMPVDMPQLRDEASQMVAEVGPRVWEWAIASGRQRWTPVGIPNPAEASRHLSRTECRRLELAELFHVSADMTALARAAGLTMPPFELQPYDLPAESGFLFFDDTVGTIEDKQGRIEIRAVSWGPMFGTAEGGSTRIGPGGGVWVSWYGHTIRADGSRDPYRLVINEEMPQPFGALNSKVVFKDGVYEWGDSPKEGMHRWFATLKTVWVLMGQSIATVSDAHFNRAAARRIQKQGSPVPKVRVIALRHHAADGSAGEGDREYHHRWVVRGHWRMQACGAGRAERRPTWIVPHVKGPDGAPLLGGEKVYALRR